MNRRKTKWDKFVEWLGSEEGSTLIFRVALIISTAFILGTLIVDYIIF